MSGRLREYLIDIIFIVVVCLLISLALSRPIFYATETPAKSIVSSPFINDISTYKNNEIIGMGLIFPKYVIAAISACFIMLIFTRKSFIKTFGLNVMMVAVSYAIVVESLQVLFVLKPTYTEIRFGIGFYSLIILLLVLGIYSILDYKKKRREKSYHLW